MSFLDWMLGDEKGSGSDFDVEKQTAWDSIKTGVFSPGPSDDGGVDEFEESVW